MASLEKGFVYLGGKEGDGEMKFVGFRVGKEFEACDIRDKFSGLAFLPLELSIEPRSKCA